MWWQPYESFDPEFASGWLAAHCDGFMEPVPMDTSSEGFVQWPEMWWQPYESFDPEFAAGWLAAHCDGFMGGWQDCNERMWHMPGKLPPCLVLPPTPPPPPLPSQKHMLDSFVEYLGESTEAEEMTSEGTSDDDSFSESCPNHASFEGKQACLEFLASVNSQDEDDMDAGSVDVTRPITPPPGLSLCGPITPPPGLCGTGSVTPPPGLCHRELITPPPGLCDTALSDGTPNGTPDLDSTCSAIAHGIPNSDAEERMSSAFSSDIFTLDEADRQTPILEHKQDVHISPIQPIRCRKPKKPRQHRTPGCAKAKKAHLQPQSCMEVPVGSTSPSKAMAVDASKPMEEQSSCGASYTIIWWYGLLAVCLLAIGIAVGVVGGMSRDQTVAQESSTSIVVIAGSSHAWATAVPRAASMRNQLVAPLARKMDIEVVRGRAIASHVMTKVEKVQTVWKKMR
jgi:hypothetical protein